MHKPLLIEIGVEELPAIPLIKELPAIKSKWEALCREYDLACDVTFHYTPRRLIFWHPNFPLKQPDREEELFGAPVEIAFKEGKPTGAALGFAKKAGIEPGELTTTQKGGKEVLYCKKSVAGQPGETLLNEMLEKFVLSLNFGRAMRWGSLEKSFIRPIRWLVVLFGETVVPAELFGVKSGHFTYGHRNDSYAKQSIASGEHYLDFLEKRGVIADAAKRREKILADFGVIEKEESVAIEVDTDLLDEVVAITEYPTAFMGSFDAKFLKLPDEVIITSMKSHQRYFPVYKQGKLTNAFIVVANSLTDDGRLIVAGNEKVLRARLEDGLFFYENDLKKGLSSDGLASVIFAEGLGSLHDKTYREHAIASELQRHLDLDDDVYRKVYNAVQLSKTDLLSEVVYEFTELQGIMGYYYALAQGEDREVALALKEQYLPLGENAELPSCDVGAITAIATKLDNLIGLFSTGKIPTGSKDPFALRRAAIGMLRIIIDRQYPLDIGTIITRISKQYGDYDKAQLVTFVYDRLFQILKEVNPSIIHAVLATGEGNVSAIHQKVRVLDAFAKRTDFENLLATFKRVANITKDFDMATLSINESLFETEYEKALYERFTRISETDYDKLLEALADLKPELDAFFDHVMVNAEEPAVRLNRKSLIAAIYNRFKEVADIKEISI
jgi:glycyl-tRNA synthetase beta chain